jgi:hypothetical protein
MKKKEDAVEFPLEVSKINEYQQYDSIITTEELEEKRVDIPNPIVEIKNLTLK